MTTINASQVQAALNAIETAAKKLLVGKHDIVDAIETKGGTVIYSTDPQFKGEAIFSKLYQGVLSIPTNDICSDFISDLVLNLGCSGNVTTGTTYVKVTDYENNPSIYVYIPAAIDEYQLLEGNPYTHVFLGPYQAVSLRNTPHSVKLIGNSVDSFDSDGYSTLVSADLNSESLSQFSFRNCSNLASVSINAPNATNLNFAFENCTSLQGISLSFNDWSGINFSHGFNGCTSLEEVTISGDNWYFANSGDMFSNCPNLKYVSFYGPSNLATTLPSSLKEFTISGLNNTTDLIYTFYYSPAKNSIEKIRMLDTPTLVNLTGFCYQCSNLQSFEANDLSSLTNAYGMFYECSNLGPSLILPISLNLKNVDIMFYGCASLQYLTLHPIEDLGYTGITSAVYAFSGMTSHSAPFGVTAPFLITATGMFSDSAFSGLALSLPNVQNADWLADGCTNLQSVTWYGDDSLDHLTSATRMFAGCSSLTEISLNAPALQSLHSTFKDCTSLTTFSLNTPSVTSMESAFEGCSSLVVMNLYLPMLSYVNRLTTGCSSLEHLSLESTVPLTITLFGEPSSLVTVVLKGNPIRILNYYNPIPANVSYIEIHNLDSEYKNGLFEGSSSYPNLVSLLVTGSCGLSRLYPNVDLGVIAFPELVQVDLHNVSGGIANFSDNTLSIGQCPKLTILNITADPGFTTSIPTTNFSVQNCPNLVLVEITIPTVTKASSMFRLCTSLVSIGTLVLGTLVQADVMFSGCSSLVTIPSFDCSSAVYVNDMFRGCSSLVTIPSLDFSSAVNANNMFRGCSSLVTIPSLDFSSVMYAGSMFNSCSSLVTIPSLDFSSAVNANDMFRDCSSLSSSGVYGIKVTHSYENCNLSPSAINNILSNLGSPSVQQSLIIKGNPDVKVYSQETGSYILNPLINNGSFVYGNWLLIWN